MKKIVIGILIIVIFIIGIFGFIYINSNDFKLKKLGYNSGAIAIINDNLKNNNVSYILSLPYDDSLVQIIEQEAFNEDDFKEYIAYYNKHNNVKTSDVVKIVNTNADKIEYSDMLISLINNSNYKSVNLERYINYYNSNPTINDEAIISIVNNDIDTVVMEYNDVIPNLLKTDYFIVENTKRYLDYYLNMTTPSLKETIVAVNSNIDYPFYTNIKSGDLSKGNLILVNKYYNLDKNFVPDNLVTIESKYGHPNQLKADAYEQYKQMCEAALLENLHLFATSPYRSYNTQTSLYADYSATQGKTAADTFSARPGHSEHQLGLAIDIVSSGSNFNSFNETMEFSWMLENAYKFGFILRYPKGKEYITGYMYEPWHYRYVGKDIAKKVVDSNLTYEEYYAYYLK